MKRNVNYFSCPRLHAVGVGTTVAVGITVAGRRKTTL